MAPDMRLPDKSTGWARETFELSVSGANGGKCSVQGLVKYGYGVSRGERPGSSPRLTHLKTGHFIFCGPQGLCKRLAEALHEYVPGLEQDPGSPEERTLTPEEIETLRRLVLMAHEEER